MIVAIIFIILGLYLLFSSLGIIVAGNAWGIVASIIILAIGFKMLRKRGICPVCGWKHFEGRMHEKFHERMQGTQDSE